MKRASINQLWTNEMNDGRAADRLITLASSISERLVTARDGPQNAESIVDHRKQTQPRASIGKERMLACSPKQWRRKGSAHTYH
ncbi:hypothetical protein AVEN_34684-1 [Araneus ventricosus]|uniref:Uncharacterized protein n=1 Tax=Araneus ventricosus TaxID=182803 RepID=A0A4Y2B2M1_ARAVE|nr:hypothetical protein AVEN_34684-1 [Araneus ventricosus]